MENEKYIVGQHVRKIRKTVGMTQTEFAELVSSKMRPASVSNWENGVSLPSPKHLVKIAYIGNTTVDEMYEPLYSIPMNREKATSLHAAIETLVSNDKFHAIDPVSLEDLKEIDEKAKEIMNDD